MTILCRWVESLFDGSGGALFGALLLLISGEQR